MEEEPVVIRQEQVVLGLTRIHIQATVSRTPTTTHMLPQNRLQNIRKAVRATTQVPMEAVVNNKLRRSLYHPNF